MNNTKYELMKERIEMLKSNFHFEPSNDEVTPQQEDFIRAFILLSHAEIESYIENVATELLDTGIEHWNSNGVANYNLASLFIWFEKGQSVNPSISDIVFKFRKLIKNNHGIKKENIGKLFEPLGYSIDDFDNFLIAELSSFGLRRGLTAHTSVRNSTYHQLNFTEEKKKIDKIVEELEKFYEKVKELQLNPT